MPRIARRHFLSAVAGWAISPWLVGCGRASTAAPTAGRNSNALYVADFRAPEMNDRELLARAFRAWANRGGGTLHLEPGHRYELGINEDNADVFEISGLQNAVLAGNGATLAIHTMGEHTYNLLYILNYQGLRIENLSAVDTGYADRYQAGAKFIVIDSNLRDSVDIVFDNVTGERLVSLIQLQALGGKRVRGVHIMPNCRATRVFYAFTCLNQGDDVTGGYSTFNCGRSYFPYGVSRHNLVINVHHQGAAFGPVAETAVVIKCYGRPITSQIRVDATFSGVLSSGGSCVTLEHQPNPAGPPSIIEDIDVRLTVVPGTRDPNSCHRFVLRTLDQSDAEERGVTRNIWRRIRIGGDLQPGLTPAIFSRARPNPPAEILIAPGTRGAEPDEIQAPGFRFRTG